MSNYINNNLQPQHAAMLLEESGIAEDVIEERGYRTIEDHKELLQLGFSTSQVSARRVPGLLLPIWETDGRNGIAVYRPDNPRVREDRRKPMGDGTYKNTVLKYEFPSGEKMRIDAHPQTIDWLGNPGRRLWITEGQKKADALISRGEIAIAILGVWNWRGENENGGMTVLADWHHVAFFAKGENGGDKKGREIIIAFDSDGWGNQHIRKAAGALKKWMLNKGADVRVIYMSPGLKNEKRGVDDFLRDGGTIQNLLDMDESPSIGSGRTSKPTANEYINVLESMGKVFRLNLCGKILEVNGEIIDDIELAKIRSAMRDLGYTSMPAIEDAVLAHAAENAYHPVKEYLDGLSFNQQDNIRELSRHFHDKHGHEIINSAGQNLKDWLEENGWENLFHFYFHKWVIGAIDKALKRTQNPMLVFDGIQGLGKSYFVAWLATNMEDYFIESAIDPEDKDSRIHLMTKWLWEVSEFGLTSRRADIEALKAFLTMRDVTVRKPYGRHAVHVPALSSFIGTINNDAGFLNDPTGSRRFHCVTVTSIDFSYDGKIDPDQIWAQAYYEWKKYPGCHILTTQGAMIRNVVNDVYESPDIVQSYIEKYFVVGNDAEGEFMTAADIVGRLKENGVKIPEHGLAIRAAACIQRLGAVKTKTNGRRGYLHVKFHQPVEEEEELEF